MEQEHRLLHKAEANPESPRAPQEQPLTDSDGLRDTLGNKGIEEFSRVATREYISKIEKKLPLYGQPVDRKQLQEKGIDLDLYMDLLAQARGGDRFAGERLEKMRAAATQMNVELPRPDQVRQVFSKSLGRLYWEVNVDSAIASSGKINPRGKWQALDVQTMEEEFAQKQLAEQAAHAAEQVRIAAEQAQFNDPGYASVEIPYAEGSIIISVSPGLADTSSALQNVPGTQGANRKGLSPSIMLENRRIGLNPFYTDVRHRTTAEQSSVHRDAETQARALEQLGIRLIQTEDGTRFKVVRPLPEGEWVTINGHRISGHETQVEARRREWEAKMKLLFDRRDEQQKRMTDIVKRMDRVMAMTKEIARDGVADEISQIPVIEKQYKEQGKEFLSRWFAVGWPMTGDFTVIEGTLSAREKILSDGSGAAASLELHLQPYLQRKAREEAAAKEKLRLEQEAAAQRAREAQEVRANAALHFAPIAKRVQKIDESFVVDGEASVDPDTKAATYALKRPDGRSVQVTVSAETDESAPATLIPFKSDPVSKGNQVLLRKEFPRPKGHIVDADFQEVQMAGATGLRLQMQAGKDKKEYIMLSRKENGGFSIDFFEDGKFRSVAVSGDETTVRALFDQINLQRQTEIQVEENARSVTPSASDESPSPSDAPAAPETPGFAGLNVRGNVEKLVEALPFLRTLIGENKKVDAAKGEKGTVSPDVQRQIDLKKRFATVIADSSLDGKAEFTDLGDANWSGRTVDKYLVRIDGKDVAHVYIGGKEGDPIYVVDPLGSIVLPMLNPSGNVEVKDEKDTKKADGTLKDVLLQVIDAANGGGAPEYWGDLPLKRSPQTKEERVQLNNGLIDMKHAEFLRVYASLRPIAITNPSPNAALATSVERHNNALPAVRAAVQKLLEGTDEDVRKTLAKAAVESTQGIPAFMEVSLLEGVATADHPEHDALWKMNVNSMLINRLRAIEKDGNLDTK
jgi:hypothetical protein